MQVPYEDKLTLRAVEKYMAAHRWDGYLNLGDFLDFNELSDFVKGKPGDVKEDVADTFDAGNAVLDRHCKLVRAKNHKARMVLLQGNHDYRAVRKGKEDTGLKKHLDVPRNLRLKERGIEWVKSWEDGVLFKLGNAHFMHGRYTGLHHAAKTANSYGVCTYYGHNHDVMLWPKTNLGDDKTIEAGSLGCLCRYDQRYLQGAPTNWQQAVSTLYLLEGGFYNLYVTRIFKHRFVGPDGVVYDGR